VPRGIALRKDDYVKRHEDIVGHLPVEWTGKAKKEEPFVDRPELERLLRAILDSGDWASRLESLREVLIKFGVKCE
jgi:hypothetical protein